MARGSPDWWYGMMPAKVVFGLGQTAFLIAEKGDIAGGSYADFCSYTVPSGFVLMTGYGSMSCSGPGIMKCALNFSGIITGDSYFDSLKITHLPDTSLYEIPAGQSVALRLYNLDTITLTFTAGIIGFEEVREP